MTLVIGLPAPMSGSMAGMEVSVIGPLELNSVSNDQTPQHQPLEWQLQPPKHRHKSLEQWHLSLQL